MITVPRSEEPRASIVIATTRRVDHLRACLASLERHACDGVPSETIVVLNGADPDVVALACNELRGATVLDVPVNIGFPAAVNFARSAATGDLLVLVHDDAAVRPGWLAPLVETADTHPEAGVVGSLVLWPDGRVQSAEVVAWQGAEWDIPDEGADPSAIRGLRAADSVGSSSSLVRAATFDAVGGLDDELYPAGLVDWTLAFSVRRLGQVVLVDPRSRVHHRRGSTLGPTWSYRAFAHERNRDRFLERFADELACLPPRPGDPAELAEAIVAARERIAAQWQRMAAAWRGPPPPAPRVSGPFARDADPAKRLDAALRFIARERSLRDAWGATLFERAERADADNALLRADRERAIEYARSLEVAREELVGHIRALEAERAAKGMIGGRVDATRALDASVFRPVSR